MEHAPFLQGFVTMVLRCSEEINNMSYVWRRLREQLGGDVDRKVNRMRFIKGRMVRVFLLFLVVVLLFLVCVCVVFATLLLPLVVAFFLSKWLGR